MVTIQVGNIRLGRTLLDRGSIVELMNRSKVLEIHPLLKVYTDGYLRVSLATDTIYILTNYIFLLVNLEGV